MEAENERRIGPYKVEHSIHVGEKEVVFGINENENYPFCVCYCTYDNIFSAPWPEKAVASDNYLEAMQIFMERLQEKMEAVRGEQEKFSFDMTPFTLADCIPDNRSENITGKVIVIDPKVNRYEYRHSACQLVLAEGGFGADGGQRGQAVFGIGLADGKLAEWNRCDILGELRPERTPEWAKEALEHIKAQEKEKKSKSREER